MNDTWDSDDIDRAKADLLAAGWVAKKPTIWKSPSGKLYAGPAHAWRVMKRALNDARIKPGAPAMRTRCSEHEITEAMIVYGGSFVSQLGRLIRLADVVNKHRLIDAFPEYIQQYDELAAMRLKDQSHV